MEETMLDMYKYERSLAGDRTPYCGVDEAGRGPLAGPVCAAAVILPEGLVIPGLNDSKKLTAKSATHSMTSSAILPWRSASPLPRWTRSKR